MISLITTGKSRGARQFQEETLAQFSIVLRSTEPTMTDREAQSGKHRNPGEEKTLTI